MKNRSNCKDRYRFVLPISSLILILVLNGCFLYQRQPIKNEAKPISKKAQKVNQVVVHVADTMFLLSNLEINGSNISGTSIAYDSSSLNYKYYNKLQNKRMGIGPVWNNGFSTQLHLYVNQVDCLQDGQVHMKLEDVAHVEWYHNNGLKGATGMLAVLTGWVVTTYNFYLYNWGFLGE